MRRLSDGSIKYTWLAPDGSKREGSEADMLHVVGRTLNGVTGVSPMTYARHMIGATLSADRAAATMFKQGLLMQGTFETEQIVPEKLRDAFQERIKAYQGAINSGKAPLLEGGIKWKSININPNDAQMLETRQFSVEQICRWFRVPPHMVGHTTNSTSWGTGLEQQKNGFLTFTLMRWLKRMQDEFNRKLFTAADRQTFFSEFNFEGLLQADSAARANFYTAMVRGGMYTRDEVREKENLRPMMGNAAVLTVEANMVPLDRLGESQVRRSTDLVPAARQAPLSLNFGINMPELKAPQVSFNHSTPINVRTPDVRVAAPTINVPEQPAPQVTINQPAPAAPAPALTSPLNGVEFTFDDEGNVTGANLK
jgi:HK97 family phage portal protein